MEHNSQNEKNFIIQCKDNAVFVHNHHVRKTWTQTGGKTAIIILGVS
jgi:lipopolysaccharide biosynthesis glycosyltransferase